MKIIVTGATGFVARHLIPHLVASGHEAFAIGHDLSRLPHGDGISPIVADLRTPDCTNRFPAGIDVILHLAQANVPFPDRVHDLWEVNASATVRLLDWARRSGVRSFVLASTGSVYGGGERPWRESDPLAGLGAYPATKIAAESMVAAFSPYFDTAILRLFGPYGPGQRARLVPGIIGRVKGGTPVSLREGGRPRINPIHIDDLVGIILDSASLRGHHLVNIGGDEVLTIRGIASIVGDALGITPTFEEASGPSGGDTVGDTSLMDLYFGVGRAATKFRDGVVGVIEELNGSTVVRTDRHSSLSDHKR